MAVEGVMACAARPWRSHRPSAASETNWNLRCGCPCCDVHMRTRQAPTAMLGSPTHCAHLETSSRGAILEHSEQEQINFPRRTDPCRRRWVWISTWCSRFLARRAHRCVCVCWSSHHPLSFKQKWSLNRHRGWALHGPQIDLKLDTRLTRDRPQIGPNPPDRPQIDPRSAPD